MFELCASILAADFANLERDMRAANAAGVDAFHIDVMDGLFVPNISIGIPVVASLRRATDMFLDVHLMIDRPHRYVRAFCDAGADLVTFHIEADEPQDIYAAIQTVKDCGKKVGLVLKPRTPSELLLPYIGLLDMVLIMTVEPGFGGQSFMEDQLPKIAAVRRMISGLKPACELEVDGGVDPVTAKLCKEAGADVLVAGSAVFKKPDRRAALETLRNA